MAYDPNVLRRASARLEEEKRRREDEREPVSYTHLRAHET